MTTMLKLFTTVFVVLSATISALAQTPKDVRYVYTEASDLNLIGKILEDTPNPYHRVDTIRYKGFTKRENQQVRCSAGLAVLFKTNSSTISVKADYAYMNDHNSTMGVATRGFDLYIKKDGKWLYAYSRCNSIDNARKGKELIMLKDMDDSMKECMLYLPIYSELNSVKIGVEEGAVIESLESPFRHRIGIFGSSFTHGISTSRPGMSYPSQLMRNTGLQILNLGCSGNCKMQPYFGEVLCDAEVDAFIFDAFSNPDAQMIEERIVPFIEQVQAAHPGIPLIFQQTIYIEGRNFSKSRDADWGAKQVAGARVMKEVMKKYDHVYFIQTNATSPDHETSVDGTHPNDYGYTLWARSIEKPLLKILKKYGIR